MQKKIITTDINKKEKTNPEVMCGRFTTRWRISPTMCSWRSSRRPCRVDYPNALAEVQAGI
jgi:hypothetical protein